MAARLSPAHGQSRGEIRLLRSPVWGALSSLSLRRRPVLCETAASSPPSPASAAASQTAAAQQPVAQAQEDDNPFEDGPLRYAPYIARAKMILLRSKMILANSARYVAYSSDVGESLRPVMSPMLVNLTYGIAGAYILGDTAYSGYKKHCDGHSSEVVAATCVHTAVFQIVASLALPAAIIHTAVHQTQHLLEKPRFAKNVTLVKYGPSGIGLAIIPFLPFMDPPLEYVIDAAFDRAWPAWRVGEKEHHH